MSPLAVVTVLALMIGLVAPIATFVVLIISQLRRRLSEPSVPRCIRCDGPLLPLLDSSHEFRGEAACLRCGTLHEGLRRKPHGVPPGAAGGAA